MEFVFEQNLEREDYVEFVYTHMISNMFSPIKRSILVISILYLLLSPLFLSGTYLFLYIGVGIVAFLYLLIRFMKKNAGNFYDKNPNQFRMTYTINEQQFTYQSDEGRLEKMWSEFYSARETENILYIYTDKLRGIAVKKNTAGDEAIAFIKKQLRENVAKPRLLKFR